MPNNDNAVTSGPIEDELDKAIMDIAKSAAARVITLIDQGKVPGYQKVPERRLYEIGSPEPISPCLTDWCDIGSPERITISTRPLTIEPEGCPGQVVQVCSVKILGKVYDLRRADDTTCEWILRVGDLVIMAWEVSSTAGGRAWNFNNIYLGEIALRMIGDDNPLSLPSNRGDVLVLIRPVSESGRDGSVPELTNDH